MRTIGIAETRWRTLIDAAGRDAPITVARSTCCAQVDVANDPKVSRMCPAAMSAYSGHAVVGFNGSWIHACDDVTVTVAVTCSDDPPVIVAR